MVQPEGPGASSQHHALFCFMLSLISLSEARGVTFLCCFFAVRYGVLVLNDGQGLSHVYLCCQWFTSYTTNRCWKRAIHAAASAAASRAQPVRTTRLAPHSRLLCHMCESAVSILCHKVEVGRLQLLYIELLSAACRLVLDI